MIEIDSFSLVMTMIIIFLSMLFISLFITSQLILPFYNNNNILL